MRQMKSGMLALAVVALANNMASAQVQNVEENAAQATRTANVMTPAQNDQQILRWVKIDCDALKHCIETCKSKVGNAEIKSFAERMIADHKALEETAKTKFAGYSELDKGTNRVATLVTDQGQSRDERLVYKPCDFVAVKKAVCDKMKSLAEKEMANLKGEEFDRAVMKHLCMGHEAAIESIDQVHSSASKELQACLTEAKTKLNEHLKACQTICKTYETTRTAN